ncbi:MAG: uroporphyrinogen decarboxylase family protein [Verrucomicrobia bacterium]|nr:uroporphyrinogen decarboxylase family protein [Verrucomicrobiota bacterium]
MNSLDRVQRSMRGLSIDYLPTFSIMIAAACELNGVKQGAYSQDPRIMADTLIQARDLCNFDGIYVSRDNWVIHEALGGPMVFPEDDEPYGPAPLLDSLRDFEKLKIPVPEEAPGMKIVLAAAREIMKRVGSRYYIQANTDCGAFSLAAILRGIQNFMMDLQDEEPALIHAYLEFCSEVVIAYNRAMQCTGVHGVQYGDSVAGLVNYHQYREFVLPVQAKIFRALRNSHCDSWLHICGNPAHVISAIAELPIQGFEVDAMVEMAEARKVMGDKMTLKGNLNTSFLLHETPDAVYRATQDIIQSGNFKTKIIISSGCGVPRMTPLENLRAMARACLEYKGR